jgi:NAD(P)H dehydrogenase (quinone)
MFMMVLIVYDSHTGNTEKMAQAVSEGVESEGVEVAVKRVEEATVGELRDVHALILGSPVYYGLPSAKMKVYIDDTAEIHSELVGKVGGAFASAGGLHTGAETTLVALNQALMIHGMVVQGEEGWNHYGAASMGAPDDRDKETCRKLGSRVARLVKRLHG